MADEVSTMRTVRTEPDSMLSKGLSVLEAVAKAGRPLKVSELSAMLEVPRATVYRLIEPLEAGGYIRRNESTREYYLWLKLLQLGEKVRNSLEVRTLAYPMMVELRDEVGLAVHLVMRDGDEAVYVEKVESNRPVRLYTQIGRRVPLHVTACPRALLAFCSDDEIEAYISKTEMVAYTASTVADAETVWAKVREIRRSGYSIAFGELEPETAAIAVPVRGNRGEVIASLSVAGPDSQFREEDLGGIIRSVESMAGRMSHELGYDGR